MKFASYIKVDKPEFGNPDFITQMVKCKSDVISDAMAYILHHSPSAEEVTDFALNSRQNLNEALSYKGEVIGEIEFFFSDQDGDNFIHNKVTAGFKFIPSH